MYRSQNTNSNSKRLEYRELEDAKTCAFYSSYLKTTCVSKWMKDYPNTGGVRTPPKAGKLEELVLKLLKDTASVRK